MTRAVLRGLAVAALVAPAPACRGKPEEETETTAAVPVRVELSRVGSIQAVVVAAGLVEPAPGADWTILAPQQARIAVITKAEGDRVRRGELLVRFDAPSLRSDVASRNAEQARARARLENARKAHARLSGLLERGIASHKEVEEAQKELQEAEAALREASETRAAAAEMASRATVFARFDGIVAHRWHNPGDIVEAVSSDPVLRVVDPSRLQVSASVPVADLPRAQPGRKARVQIPGAPAEMAETARVLSRPAAVDATTGTATIRLALPPSTRLAAGTPVQVEIAAEEAKDVVLVPSAALVREENETLVYVVGPDKRAHRRAVLVGIVSASEAEIRSGVAASEPVVVRGQEDLPDGAAVTVTS
jgi:RND family efflux transporter MFP subunit